MEDQRNKQDERKTGLKSGGKTRIERRVGTGREGDTSRRNMEGRKEGRKGRYKLRKEGREEGKAAIVR